MGHGDAGRHFHRHAQGRIVSMLEGGYALHAFAPSAAAHLKVLSSLEQAPERG